MCRLFRRKLMSVKFYSLTMVAEEIPILFMDVDGAEFPSSYLCQFTGSTYRNFSRFSNWGPTWLRFFQSSLQRCFCKRWAVLTVDMLEFVSSMGCLCAQKTKHKKRKKRFSNVLAYRTHVLFRVFQQSMDQPPRSPTSIEHTISYTISCICHLRNENIGYTQRFCFRFQGFRLRVLGAKVFGSSGVRVSGFRVSGF